MPMPDKILTWVVTLLLVVNLALTGILFNEVKPGWLDAALGTAPAETEAAEAAPPEKTPDPESPTANIVAWVNGIPLTQAALIDHLNTTASPQTLSEWNTAGAVPQEALQDAVNQLAIDELLLQRARDAGLQQDERIRAEIKQQTREIMVTAYLDSVAENLIDENQVQAEYQRLVTELAGKTESRVRHILSETEAESIAIHTAVAADATVFAEMAQLRSLDQATAANGGDLGYVTAGQLLPEFEGAVAGLDIGQLSAPFQTTLGWHLAIVDDRREVKPLPYDQAQAIIQERLLEQAMNDYLNTLLTQAELELATTDDAATGNSAASEQSTAAE